jgi:predicted patatin/cPLA2 family phospholipase
MRAVFTAGVLDGFAARREPPFDLVVGVSAGACCATSYLAGQHGRNRRIFVERMTSRVFVDPARLLTGGSVFDMDYLMGPVARVLDPLDLEAVRASGARFEAGVAEAHTAAPCYLPADGPDLLQALLASVAIPVLYRGGPIAFRGGLYFDGGVVDPIPVERALALGATEVTAVLTHPWGWRPEPMSRLERWVAWVALARYPALRRALDAPRRQAYHRALDLLAAPPLGVRCRMYAPPGDFGVSRTTADPARLEVGYALGLAAVPRIWDTAGQRLGVSL